MNSQEIGLFIAKLRKEKGLTQRELADKLMVTDKAISKWERGGGCPDISLLDDLSKELDVSILEILKGKKLNNKEIIPNDSIIETMKYTKTNTKKQIYQNINKIAYVGFFIIIFLILFNFIKSEYYFNKKYYVSENQIYNLDDIENKVNIILNNKGVFTDDEYEVILKFVNQVNDLKNYDKASKLYQKEYYTYDEMREFVNTNDKYYMDNNHKFDDDIIDIILKYDVKQIDNIKNYYLLKAYNISISSMSNYLSDVYKNFNTVMSKEIPFNSLIYNKYDIYKVLLNLIIEVGEIHE